MATAGRCSCAKRVVDCLERCLRRKRQEDRTHLVLNPTTSDLARLEVTRELNASESCDSLPTLGAPSPLSGAPDSPGAHTPARSRSRDASLGTADDPPLLQSASELVRPTVRRPALFGDSELAAATEDAATAIASAAATITASSAASAASFAASAATSFVSAASNVPSQSPPPLQSPPRALPPPALAQEMVRDLDSGEMMHISEMFLTGMPGTGAAERSASMRWSTSGGASEGEGGSRWGESRGGQPRGPSHLRQSQGWSTSPREVNEASGAPSQMSTQFHELIGDGIDGDDSGDDSLSDEGESLVHVAEEWLGDAPTLVDDELGEASDGECRYDLTAAGDGHDEVIRRQYIA